RNWAGRPRSRTCGPAWRRSAVACCNRSGRGSSRDRQTSEKTRSDHLRAFIHAPTSTLRIRFGSVAKPADRELGLHQLLAFIHEPAAATHAHACPTHVHLASTYLAHVVHNLQFVIRAVLMHFATL